MKQQVVINSEQYIEVTIYDIVILQIPKSVNMLNLENRIWKYPSITEGLPMTRGKYDQLKLRR